jgi:hypothetical protein
MVFAGLKKPEERADLIAYLKDATKWCALLVGTHAHCASSPLHSRLTDTHAARRLVLLAAQSGPLFRRQRHDNFQLITRPHWARCCVCGALLLALQLQLE